MASAIAALLRRVDRASQGQLCSLASALGAAIRVLFGLPETGPGQENSGSLLLHFLARPIHGLPGDATSTQVTRCAVLAKKKLTRHARAERGV